MFAILTRILLVSALITVILFEKKKTKVYEILESYHNNVYYTPANFVCGGYTVFMLSVRVCVRLSVRP